MLWQVRALLEDRPGAMAALAAGCGARLVNILGLQIFPAADGRVVDELVLHTPGGWSATDVERLCVAAGVAEPVVSRCSPHALEDQPVRYLRAAQALAERPELLEEQLCRLLDASPGSVPLLDDEHGPAVSLSRAVPFTDTELARAAELRRLAAVLLGTGVGQEPVPVGRAAEVGSAAVGLRRGTARDVRALVALHARCSAETVYRRYHAPVPHLSHRLARALLEPVDGLSLVLTVGEELAAVAVLGPPVAQQPGTDPEARRETGGTEAELGLLVEDRWQRQGHGTRLLRAVAAEAAARGLDTLTCLVQTDNAAVLRTVRRAGLRARADLVDGLTRYRIPVGPLAEACGPGAGHGNRPVMGQVTTPLVALLHDRRELREVCPPADLIDQAVRGGA